MMKAIENALDFVLRCIMPLPYCEVDGHKFWRKSSYDSWLATKELNRMRKEMAMCITRSLLKAN